MNESHAIALALSSPERVTLRYLRFKRSFPIAEVNKLCERGLATIEHGTAQLTELGQHVVRYVDDTGVRQTGRTSDQLRDAVRHARRGNLVVYMLRHLVLANMPMVCILCR